MHLPTLLRIYKCGDPPSAFQAMAESLATQIPLRSTFWVDVTMGAVQSSWPAAVDPSSELLQTVVHTLRPEVFPLDSVFPADAERFPDSEMLLLPLEPKESCGVAVLVADQGAFGEEPNAWIGLADALGHVIQQHQRLHDAEQERKALRQRVEESEALHTLGLAVNRTLDPEEVLTLVARLTRTLLGAHYVTVNTVDDGQVHAVASVGLRTREVATKDYFLASKVVESAKPITVGGEGSAYSVSEFPFHQEEGMQTGLGIPLSLFGETFGALVIGYRRPYQLAARDTRLALTLAGHAAVAISNARLHSTLAERSEELERAYEELRRTSQLKERFFASMSHELRTPVNGIMGFQNLLLEGLAGEIDDRARTYLGKANRAAENLLDLVNDLLDYAKLEAGKVQLDVRPTAAWEIVEDAVANVETQARNKRITLDAPRPNPAIRLHTDPDRVRQILVNLLSNAIKFTPVGGQITLRTAKHDGSVPALTFEVRDTGPGIAPEDHEAIFREFEQVKGTKGGTGLGLPISRKLAQLLDGDLRVESAVGSGSTFVLRLPVEQVTEVPAGVV